MRDTEREREKKRERERQRRRQREKQAPCREPDVGLDPGNSGSCPEPKADCSTAEPPRHPIKANFKLSMDSQDNITYLSLLN